jgi:ribosomal protein L11 methyltransferase
LLYSEEGEKGGLIYAIAPGPVSLPAGFSAMLPWELPAIDWEQQWQQHGLAYDEGYIHVDLSTYSDIDATPPVLKLQPGAGFGDLSHVTTRQSLKLMADLVTGRPCVDVGCGSGILALAACAWGACPVIGLDIDPLAVEHAQANAKLNGLDAQIVISTVVDVDLFALSTGTVAVMNMISSEQKEAWQALTLLWEQCDELITAGIYSGEEETYLQMFFSYGWTLRRHLIDGEWHAFHFSRSAS